MELPYTAGFTRHVYWSEILKHLKQPPELKWKAADAHRTKRMEVLSRKQKTWEQWDGSRGSR